MTKSRISSLTLCIEANSWVIICHRSNPTSTSSDNWIWFWISIRAPHRWSCGRHIIGKTLVYAFKFFVDLFTCNTVLPFLLKWIESRHSQLLLDWLMIYMFLEVERWKSSRKSFPVILNWHIRLWTHFNF